MGMFEEISDRVFEVELSGRVFKVVFTMNAMESLESRGLKMEELEGRGLPVYERSLTMLWAGTRDFHGEYRDGNINPDYVTREELGRLMEPWQLAEVDAVIDKAITAAYTPKKKVVKELVRKSPTGS